MKKHKKQNKTGCFFFSKTLFHFVMIVKDQLPLLEGEWRTVEELNHQNSNQRKKSNRLGQGRHEQERKSE